MRFRKASFVVGAMGVLSFLFFVPSVYAAAPSVDSLILSGSIMIWTASDVEGCYGSSDGDTTWNNSSWGYYLNTVSKTLSAWAVVSPTKSPTTYTLTCTRNNFPNASKSLTAPLWVPYTDNVCSGQSFTQTDGIGGSRTATGTNGALCSVPLTVTKLGNGSGNITGSPVSSFSWSGNIGVTNYIYNTLVTLTASASSDSYFAGWQGEGCSGQSTCAIWLNTARSVWATFSLKAPVLNYFGAYGGNYEANVNRGDAITLSWSSSYTSSCSVSPGGWTGTSGSQSTGNLTNTTSYSINCPGPGGNDVHAYRTIAVCGDGSCDRENYLTCPSDCPYTPPPPPPSTPAPTATLTASLNTVTSGGRATLTWSSTDATSCTAGGPWSNSGSFSGSGLTDPLTSGTTFTFQCTGSGGTSSLQSVTINVSGSSSCANGANNPTTCSICPSGQSMIGGTCQQAPSESCSVPVILTFGSSWTIPATVTSIKVWAIGAGGGGAGSTGNDSTSGGGGGAGGVAYKTFYVTPGQSLTYSIGASGQGGIDTNNGNNGGNTTATYGGATITARGGSGGQYNYRVDAPGGTGSGGDMAVTGGTGAGVSGDTGGGGGGAIGGAAGAVNGCSGGAGAQSVDVSSLFSVLSALGYSTIFPGSGSSCGSSSINDMNGGSASGFGSGGGGAGYYGGNGGAGKYGGGGGGASGYTASNKVGGSGGSGAIVINPITCEIPIPTATLIASPTTVNYSQSSTLSYSSSNTSSCSINNSIGTVTANTAGTKTVSPTSDTTYTLSCAGASASENVLVAAGSISSSASSCEISSGSGSCPVNLSWSSVNFSSPAVTNAAGTSLSTFANRTDQPATVPYGGDTFVIKNGSFVHNSVAVSASCSTTSSWNSNSGKCVGNAASGTISASSTLCTIAAGSNTCSTNLTWNIINAQHPNLYSSYTGATLSTSASGNNLLANVTNGVTTFSIRNSSSVINSVTVTGSCASGSTWNGSSCARNVPPTATLTASPNPVIYNGRPTLTWSSTDATSCIAGGPWSNLTPPVGNSLNGNGLTDQLTSNTTFTFQCTGPGGTSPLQAVTVNVSAQTCANGANNPPTCNTCSDPLAWNGSSCVTCNGGCSGGVCNNGANNPPTCNLYTPTATLSASQNTIISGKSSTLSWNSTNATSCVSAGGFSTGGATSGTASTGALSETSTYQVSCTGTGGTSSAQTTVNVIYPQVSITANPQRVRSGSTTVISWSATDVNNCTVNGPNILYTGNGMPGNQSVAITNQSTYTINCDSIVSGSTTVNILTNPIEF